MYRRHRWLGVGVLSIMGLQAGATAALVTATGLKSFEGLEEPSVVYHPGTDTFTNDTYQNIVDEGGGMVRFSLRYNPPSSWDGDRTTTETDRQRAEVKGLGVHQKDDQTFEYSFDFRTDPNFLGTSSFCHIFQLKATDGDDGAPLVTLSLSKNGVGRLQLWSGDAANSTVVRTFSYTADTWEHADILIRVADDATGLCEASINGDTMKGAVNVPVYRPDADDYRPKWGFYRGINSGIYVGTNYIEDKGISAQRIMTAPAPEAANVGVLGVAAMGMLLRRRRL